MKQEELRSRVRELFEIQDFDLKPTEHGFKAFKEDLELELKVFSSKKYSKKDLKHFTNEDDKVFVDKGFEELKDSFKNDFSVLNHKNSEEEFETPSYEVIGEIAVISNLTKFNRDEAVQGILHHQPQVQTVLLKKEGLKGEYRVGEYEKLYGDNTETTHTEFGCNYRVNPTKVYFSERFSTERKRIVDKIKDGEKVLIMFSGIGPFAIMAAKLANPSKVVAVEKNPVAARYQRENIRLNSVEDIVDSVEGDVAEKVPELGSFDRIIMPLPESADKFLKLAFEHTVNGGTVHYYRFLEDNNWDLLEEEVREASSEAGKNVQVANKAFCGERAAYIDRVCLDIFVE